MNIVIVGNEFFNLEHVRRGKFFPGGPPKLELRFDDGKTVILEKHVLYVWDSIKRARSR